MTFFCCTLWFDLIVSSKKLQAAKLISISMLPLESVSYVPPDYFLYSPPRMVKEDLPHSTPAMWLVLLLFRRMLRATKYCQRAVPRDIHGMGGSSGNNSSNGDRYCDPSGWTDVLALSLCKPFTFLHAWLPVIFTFKVREKIQPLNKGLYILIFFH